MHQHSTVLRAAKPTLEEGRVFARYLDTAAEGFFRFMLGRRAVDILATAFLEPDHDLSFQNVTFAERHRRSSGRPLEEAAGKWNLQMMVVTTLFAPLLRIIDTIDDGDFYLQAIAVDKELRGEGVGSTLMDFVEESAVACGSGRLALDVSAKNEGARQLYERRGMAVTSQWPERLPIPGLKLLRMTKELVIDTL
jgi:ribosomal protein S18 acetylase RimI-like enzyme